ncbi:hypothetical protein V6N13_052894 [Hibiscus sabdariffa]
MIISVFLSFRWKLRFLIRLTSVAVLRVGKPRNNAQMEGSDRLAYRVPRWRVKRTRQDGLSSRAEHLKMVKLLSRTR